MSVRKDKVDLNKFVLALLFTLIGTGANLYALFYYAGLDATDGLGIRLAQLIVVSLLATVLLLFVIKRQLIPQIISYQLFLVLIFYLTSNAIWQSAPREYLPSVLRFVCYLAAFILGYRVLKTHTPQQTVNFLYKVFRFLSITMLFWGGVEMLHQDMIFINGAFRSSAGFKLHPLAFGMFAFVLLAFLGTFFIYSKRKKIHLFLILILLLYLFLNSHSRLLTVGLFISFFVIYYFNSRSIVKKLLIGSLSLIMLFGFYNIIINSDFFPRLKEVFVAEHGIKDSSTKTRFKIIEESLAGMTLKDFLVGQGIGGFHNFYYSISLKEGVAAHNNLLLFIVEGGMIGFILFLLVEFLFLKTIVPGMNQYNYSRDEKIIVVASAAMFLGIELFGVLLNNYYFYQSETLVWLFLGMAYNIIYKYKHSTQ